MKLSPAGARRLGLEVPAAKGKGRATQKPGQAAEEALSATLRLLGIPHEVQYRWHPERRWQSDAAIPERRLLVEVDGRAHIAGYERFCADMQRRRAATFAGWSILAFTPDEARNGTAALEVERWLSLPKPDTV